MGKMTELKQASYSMDVALHPHEGMRANGKSRDPKKGCCYKNGGAPPWGYVTEKVQRGVDRKGAGTMKPLWERNESAVVGRGLRE